MVVLEDLAKKEISSFFARSEKKDHASACHLRVKYYENLFILQQNGEKNPFMA